MVMEFVEGVTLHQRIRAADLQTANAIDIL